MANNMIAPEFDFSGQSDSDMNAIIALADAYIKRFTELKKQAVAAQLDRYSEEPTQQAMLGDMPLATITHRAQGEGKWVVKDPYSYASWLVEHGHDNAVEMVAVPTQDAAEPAFIEAVVSLISNGEIPAGVEFKPGSKETLSVKLDADFAELFTKQIQQAAMSMLQLADKPAEK